jgi:hypothetical protein
MTDYKQVSIVSPSIKANSPKTLSVSRLSKQLVSYLERFSYINFQQWLLLLLLNLISFSFIALAYLCCADN